MCEQIVCVSKLYVEEVEEVEEEAGGGGGPEEEAGYRIKNKNPTQRCGEFCRTGRKQKNLKNTRFELIVSHC